MERWHRSMACRRVLSTKGPVIASTYALISCLWGAREKSSNNLFCSHKCEKFLTYCLVNSVIRAHVIDRRGRSALRFVIVSSTDPSIVFPFDMAGVGCI